MTPAIGDVVTIIVARRGAITAVVEEIRDQGTVAVVRARDGRPYTIAMSELIRGTPR